VTVWECSDAVAAGRVDWVREVGPTCPICGRRDCWRQIPAYQRTVIELFPFREGTVQVARFQCRATGRTFSLLPVWLVPYHRNTAGSMLMALLLAAAVDEHGIQSLFAVAEKLLEPDGRTTGYLPGAHEETCPVYPKVRSLDPPWAIIG